jgi:hypothetical protein
MPIVRRQPFQDIAAVPLKEFKESLKRSNASALTYFARFASLLCLHPGK